MTSDYEHALQIAWVGSDDDTAALAAFFVAHVDPSYISHGEIFCGRATTPDAWAPDLFAVVRAELDEIVAGDPTEKRAFLARSGGSLVAMGIVALELAARAPHAVIEDIVVDRARRGQGLGGRVLSSLTAMLHELGARSLFLESGIHNERAHAFFHDAGFHTVSVVMRKEL